MLTYPKSDGSVQEMAILDREQIIYHLTFALSQIPNDMLARFANDAIGFVSDEQGWIEYIGKDSFQVTRIKDD